VYAVRTVHVTTADDALGAFERLRAEPLPFHLGGPVPTLGSRPFALLAAHGDQLTLVEGRRVHHRRGDPLAALQELLDAHRIEYAGNPLPFCGGAVGYLGYGLRRFIEDLPAAVPDDLGLPDLYVAFYDRVIAFPEGPGRAHVVERQPRLKPAVVPEELLRPMGAASASFTRTEYLRAIARAQRHIKAGDIYEVNLSRRIVERTDADPWDVYRRLPAPFACFLPVGQATLLSGSPELFLDVRDRRVVTRPIKGTRPRGPHAAEDRRRIRELAHSEKDHAELAMVVDLERNDLGRVCEIGSVTVREPWVVETYPTVHHLVATVEGRLREGATTADLLRAAFPGGSVTGCPKIRAMQIIDELEPVARGPYTGAIGTFGFDGRVVLSVAIRILVMRDGRAVIPVGGAITADSDPEAEYEETEVKARAARRALGTEAPVAADR
jgi:para-aminobenzoate synthetase component 1